jgi:hypothetical protein
MSKFITELEIKGCHWNENLWELSESLIYASDLLKDPLSSSSMSGVVVVPKGFYTDLASTRHIPLVSFIWGDRAHREAVIHDYLYRVDSDPVVSFGMANSVFIEAMEARDKSFWVKYPMFWGVWLGGFFSYHTKKIDWHPGDDPPVCEDPNTAVQP